MKKSLPALFAFLAALSSAPAAVLVGFHDFETSTTSESHDAFTAGFSGTVTKNTDSRTAGGSDDDFYGNSGLASGTTGDGFLRILAGNFTITTTLSAGASTAFTLETLYFDATTTTGSGDLTVSYSLNGGPTVSLTPSAISLVNTTASDTVRQPYPDYGVNFSAVTMNPGDTLVLTFTVANGSGRMDNIALTGSAVPEPSSALMLAPVSILCFQRRRKSA